jgi:hypothetical protein
MAPETFKTPTALLGLKKSDPRRHASSSVTQEPAAPQASTAEDNSRAVADKARA